MPTTEQLIAWGTTALVVVTGIADAYRKRRGRQAPEVDDLARLRAENEWLWDEVLRLRGLLAGAGGEVQGMQALRAAIRRAREAPIEGKPDGRSEQERRRWQR